MRIELRNSVVESNTVEDAVAIPDRLETLTVQLGPDVVFINRVNKQWEINCNTNIKVVQVPPSALNSRM